MATPLKVLWRTGKPMRRGWVAAAVLLAATAALVPVVAGAWRGENAAHRDRVMLGSLHDAVLYDDEVLTMSARMAAATGDLAWIERYDAFVVRLNASLHDLAALDAHGALATQVAATSQANDALVAMEGESFRLTRAGQGAEALRLLTSPEYERQKAIYAAGNEAAFAHLSADLAAREQAAQARLAWAAAGFGSTFALALALAAWTSYDLQRARRAHLAEQIESLRQLSEYRGWFINNASHELATPLTPLRLQLAVVQRLAAALENAQLHSSLHVIDRSVMRLAAVLKEMLVVARLQSSQDLALERLDLAAVCRAAVDEIRPSATGKGLALAMESPPRLEAVADGGLLREVLLNLLANAVRFTPPGGAVHLRLAQSGDAATIEVKDTGRGMAADTLQRLFTPFFHAENHGEGVGLGLYLCRMLVARHDGTITATSDGPGRGATFTVRLPLAGPALEHAVARSRKEARRP